VAFFSFVRLSWLVAKDFLPSLYGSVASTVFSIESFNEQPSFFSRRYRPLPHRHSFRSVSLFMDFMFFFWWGFNPRSFSQCRSFQLDLTSSSKPLSLLLPPGSLIFLFLLLFFLPRYLSIPPSGTSFPPSGCISFVFRGAFAVRILLDWEFNSLVVSLRHPCRTFSDWLLWPPVCRPPGHY